MGDPVSRRRMMQAAGAAGVVGGMVSSVNLISMATLGLAPIR